MPQFSVSESNSSATSPVSGNVGGAGFTLLGIARAGSSSSGAGQVFQGTYGTLVMNANGPFTYQLDNADADTNVLGAGMTALDRFTYTYLQGGVAHTGSISFQVNGIDEPGQIVTSESDWHLVTDSTTFSQLFRLNSSADYGIMIDGDWGEV